MRSVKISEFKAKCLRMLDEIARTGEALLITRRGRALARVLPVSTGDHGSWLGSMAGTAEMLDDLTEPVSDAEDWEALR